MIPYESYSSSQAYFYGIGMDLLFDTVICNQGILKIRLLLLYTLAQNSDFVLVWSTSLSFAFQSIGMKMVPLVPCLLNYEIYSHTVTIFLAKNETIY